jgi:hypothetical protein
LTCYWDVSTLPLDGPLWSLDQKRRHGELDYAYEEPIHLSFASDTPPASCRSCIVSCFRGESYSGTFRIHGNPFPRAFVGAPKHNWLCSPHHERFRIQTYQYAETLWAFIFGPDKLGPEHGGLIVLAGSTDSAKTQISQSLVLRSILHAARNRITELPESEPIAKPERRLPHLVTFEDPMEAWKVALTDAAGSITNGSRTLRLDPSNDDTISPLKLGFCLTPRQKGTDIGTLHAALRHARRQTPTCFFVGEVRDANDWRDVVDFAGSGHLIVVTTHAATLNETMSRILAACSARTAAQRREIGASIRGVVHLVKAPIQNSDIIFPSVWAQSPTALSSLVADGLSSVAPNGYNVLGYSQFLDRFPRLATGAMLNAARGLDLKVLRAQ